MLPQENIASQLYSSVRQNQDAMTTNRSPQHLQDAVATYQTPWRPICHSRNRWSLQKLASHSRNRWSLYKSMVTLEIHGHSRNRWSLQKSLVTLEIASHSRNSQSLLQNSAILLVVLYLVLYDISQCYLSTLKIIVIQLQLIKWEEEI